MQPFTISRYRGYVPFDRITHLKDGKHIVLKYLNKPGFSSAWGVMKCTLKGKINLDWMESDTADENTNKIVLSTKRSTKTTASVTIEPVQLAAPSIRSTRTRSALALTNSVQLESSAPSIQNERTASATTKSVQLAAPPIRNTRSASATTNTVQLESSAHSIRNKRTASTAAESVRAGTFVQRARIASLAIGTVPLKSSAHSIHNERTALATTKSVPLAVPSARKTRARSALASANSVQLDSSAPSIRNGKIASATTKPVTSIRNTRRILASVNSVHLKGSIQTTPHRQL